MKSTIWRFGAIALITLFVITVPLAAQKNDGKVPAYPYVLNNVGNLSDYNSWLFLGPPAFRLLTHLGVVVDAADTGESDPNSPCFTDCSVNHAVRWENGVLTDLGSLGNKNSSAPLSISENGLRVVGLSENGTEDPLTGYPEYRAVLWRKGHAIRNLGTFGGNVSSAVSVNNHGQVVGGATNATRDHYAAKIGPCWSLNCWPAKTQWRAFIWQQGVMTDLGTLGTGKDAIAGLLNESGQVAGVSYTNTTANQVTKMPTQDPFFWEQASGMVDAGTLGGTLGYPTSLNNHGQMVGQSNLAGDQTYHPFLWEKGKQMQDLGTLGGDSGTATWINDAGDIVGGAWTNGNQAFHAVLWKNGKPQDLGTIAGFQHSIAYSINSKGEIVGCVMNNVNACTHGVLWKNGTARKLNKLIPPRSGTNLTLPVNINDRSEIAVWGDFERAFTHASLLTPRAGGW